jgi:D-glucosaminate-6-phosphate ammonia-lyase
MNLLQRLDVEQVINASGRMTRLGVNTLTDDVIDVMALGGRNYVDIEQLHEKVGEHIADLLGAEGAMVTTGAAAGISLMVAACVAGDDTSKIASLPGPVDGPTTFLIQAGHQVDFGAPVNQMVRIGGGVPVPIGSVNRVREEDLLGAITPDVAGFIYVQSHHAVQKGTLSLLRCIEICSLRGVPVLVDAAAEEDLRRYIGSGADLVTFSGGKAIGGPTSGIIAGNRRLVHACRAQNAGIGRPMKVGKEQLLGLAVALEQYLTRDNEAEAARCSRLVNDLIEGFSAIKGLNTIRLDDEAGRGIERAGIQLDPESAAKLVKHLTDGSPPVFPRTHLVDAGIVAFDPRPLEDTHVEIILERVRSFFARREP